MKNMKRIGIFTLSIVIATAAHAETSDKVLESVSYSLSGMTVTLPTEVREDGAVCRSYIAQAGHRMQNGNDEVVLTIKKICGEPVAAKFAAGSGVKSPKSLKAMYPVRVADLMIEVPVFNETESIGN